MDLYTYKAKVTDVYDGDTITCEVDLGFEVTFKVRVRLAGVDTPELRGEEREAGLVVRDIVREMILGKEIYLMTDRDRTGKYGRYIATVLVKDFNHIPHLLNESEIIKEKLNLNQWLVDNDYAEAYGG